jgi:signal transduction histidine kinase
MSSSDLPAVLYVDDEPINLRVFDANFRNRFHVITCTSGVGALEILREKNQEIGVLLSDQRMPEMTGTELLEKAREIAPEVQRMIVTAYSDVRAVMEAVNRGQVSRYFVKPWVQEELGAALEDALRIFQLQGKLRTIEMRMLHSERLATIGQVSAGIAHELMNPVSYLSQNVMTLKADVRSLADLLAPILSEQPNRPLMQTLDDLPNLISDIESGINHIRKIALGIRSQVSGDDQEAATELSEVAEFALKLARAEIRQRARLSTSGPPLKVHGGPVKLTQVLLNLIVNAAHSLQERERKGQIEVSWKEVPDGKVQVQVRDNGCGIPPELHQRVFEPFFTTKTKDAGTGLGLPICRDLIQSMGGQISLDSAVGVGTTVEIILRKA